MKNNGQIIRSSKNGKSNYTPISNEILQSKILTCEQKSILVHLLSLPSDWSIYKTTFWKQMNIGRDRYLKAWKGLVELGYIVENVITGKNNLIEGYSYIVYEEPISVNPSSSQPEIDIQKNSLSEIPNIGNTEIQSTQEPVDIQSNNLESNNIQSNNTEKNIIIESNNIKEIDINTSTNTGPVILGEIEILQKNYIKLYGERSDLLKKIEKSCQTGMKLTSEIAINEIKRIDQIKNYHNFFRDEEIDKLQLLVDDYWYLNDEFEKCMNSLNQKLYGDNCFSTEEDEQEDDW